jgi:hypothetical protein
MKLYLTGFLSAIGLGAGLAGAAAFGQAGADTVEAHVAAARTAAGQQHTALLSLCDAPAPAPGSETGLSGTPSR